MELEDVCWANASIGSSDATEEEYATLAAAIACAAAMDDASGASGSAAPRCCAGRWAAMQIKEDTAMVQSLWRKAKGS